MMPSQPKEHLIRWPKINSAIHPGLIFFLKSILAFERQSHFLNIGIPGIFQAICQQQIFHFYFTREVDLLLQRSMKEV